MKLTFIDENYALGTYDPDSLMIKVIWKGSQTSKEYRDTFLMALDIAAKNKVHFYISDVREQRIVGPEDRKWFQDSALPRALEAGLLKGAVVFEGNVFKKYYLNNILNFTKKFGIPFKFFYTMEEAENWLTEKLN